MRVVNGLRTKQKRGRRAAALIFAVSSAARAATWDPIPFNGIIDGGPSTWDLTLNNWTSDGGLTNIPWIDTDAALFSGPSGGLVTISGAVSASSLTFDAPGYLIDGPATLTMGVSLVAHHDATIAAPINAPGGLFKSGSATVTLTSLSNQFGGPISITEGALRFENPITIGATGLNLDLRGGTLVSPNPIAYAPAHILTGFGQLSAPAHIIPFGGATFHANDNAPTAAMLTIAGLIDESAGSKAPFQIGDNDTLALALPAPYEISTVTVDPQSDGGIARIIVRQNTVTINSAAFINANNRVQLEAAGGTIITDLGGSGAILGPVPVWLGENGAFITNAPAFLVSAGQTIGGQGTLFAFNGTAATNVTLNGVLDLNGALAGAITAGTGTIRLDAGETLSLQAPADIAAMTLAYAGETVAPAVLEAASSGVVRIRTGAPIAAPFGPFNGSREFRAASGILQIDAADAATVTITGSNTLSIDRTADAIANPTELGTISLDGGAFQVGSGASTTTVTPGAIFSGRGMHGHATPFDSFVNQGTVAATTGPLTISAASIRGSGAWDPNGQTILFMGGVANETGNPTQLRIIGSNGGRVQIATASSYSGGTIIDGNGGIGGTNAVGLRVMAAGALGTGPVTLNTGALVINSDSSLNFSALPISVTGTGASSISFDRSGTSITSRTITLGPVNVNGAALGLSGANSYTLTLNGLAVGSNGASLSVAGTMGGATINANGFSLGGNVSLSVAGATLNTGALSGAGSITRTFNSGTLVFNTAASGFAGNVFTSGGTTNFTAANALAGGTFGFAGGSININAANALNAASGTVSGGTINLTTANALSGSTVNLSSGTIRANAANSLGSGNITMTGGRLELRSDASANFGGNFTVAGDVASNLVADRISGAGAGGNHSINSLTLTGLRLNLGAAAGYGLNILNPIIVNGTAQSRLVHDAATLIAPGLVLNGNLLLTGSGPTTIGQLSGSGTLSKSSSSSITLSGPAAGFTGTFDHIGGVLNLGGAAGSLSGGNLFVEGGEVNAAVVNALVNTPTILSSGFIDASATHALSGTTIEMDNGTLLAEAPDVFGTSAFLMLGGNLTATAPNALGTTTIPISGGILALRNDISTAFGGHVTLNSGTSFVALSVARASENGTTGNTLSISSLTIARDTVNITGADDYTLAVTGPVNITIPALLINATAADALFAAPINYSGALVKDGVRKLTLGGGAMLSNVVNVNNGTLAINGVFNGAGANVGGAEPATLELGGAGINAPGPINLLNGTLRINKPVVADAIPAAQTINGGITGNVTVVYTGPTSGTLANPININTTAAPRTLTLSSSGTGSALLFTGSIARTGANTLTVVGRADTAGSRLILGVNPTFDIAHGGGIVVARGTVPTGAGPFGPTTNAVALTFADSTIGTMVADGQSAATFSKTVTTPVTDAPRMRLGALRNPAGAAAQTVNIQSTFSWNDPNTPLAASGTASANAAWNGLFAESSVLLSINSGAILDNIISASGTNVTATAPVFVGGGGTVRIASGFNESTYRNLAAARGLAGTVNVLDDTTLESATSFRHFDAVQLNGGAYRVNTSAQTMSGGFSVQPSPIDPSRTTSRLITDANFGVSGTGIARAFRIGAGQILIKSGASTFNITGDQTHGPGSTLAATQGTINVNTDAGANSLSITASSGATVNLNTTQHLAQVVINGGTVSLSASGVIGGKLLDTTGVLVTSGRLDLANNHMIVDYDAASPLLSIRSQLASGYNAPGPRWGGNGIVSSTAAANPKAAIGYAEASTVLSPAGGNFAGENVDGTSVLLRHTILGDANLDGQVGFVDLVTVSANFGVAPGTRTWAHGDFDYDGNVSFFDLISVAANFGGALPASGTFSPEFEQALSAAMTHVPEPAAAAFVGVAVLATRPRRRRNSQ